MLKSLILAGVVLGIFLVLVLRSGKRKPGTHLLIGWLITLSLQLLFYYDNLSPHPFAPLWVARLGFALPLLSSPVLYLYIYSLSLKPLKIWPHLVPYCIYSAILFFVPTITVSNGFPHFTASVPNWLGDFLFYLLALVPAVYVCLTVIQLWRLQKWLALSFIVLFAGLFSLIRFGAPYGLISYRDLFTVVAATLALYVFFIGYYALKPADKPAYQNSGLSQTTAQSLFKRLTLHMQQDKPFLKDNLTLDVLATNLDVPAYQLSQAINQTAGTNFFLWVNTYRVRAVQERLTDPAYANYSILGIAYDCGFSSKSSFNKVFKEITGETPSAYQQRGASL